MARSERFSRISLRLRRENVKTDLATRGYPQSNTTTLSACPLSCVTTIYTGYIVSEVLTKYKDLLQESQTEVIT